MPHIPPHSSGGKELIIVTGRKNPTESMFDDLEFKICCYLSKKKKKISPLSSEDKYVVII
jgi:hypothetical protein